MPDLQQLIQSGSAHIWLYLPVAILLGALHGLEPGHSKTMMAAFIIAIRGTVWQAILLGLSAAISHSLLIWILAALALNFGSSWNVEHTEPYFHLASAAMVLGLALWMFFRTRREVREAHEHQHALEHGRSHEKHEHELSKVEEPSPVVETEPKEPSPGLILTGTHDHWNSGAHSHTHQKPAHGLRAGEAVTASGLIIPAGMVSQHASAQVISPEREPVVSGSRMRRGQHDGMLLDTGHGWLEVCIHENAASPRFRIYPCRASGEPVPLPKGTHLALETSRLDGRVQAFRFEAKDGFWEATTELPRPHDFLATITLGHSDHAHTYRLRFRDDGGEIGKPPAATEVVEDDGVEYQDAHERAHAQDIARRFANRAVTTPQIVLFGITGGLMPCPAAFTVLLVCLQVKRVTLGFSLVAAFSFGLALTMVAVGVIAAWSMQKAHRKFSGLGEWMRRAPYISCALLVLLAAFMAWQGWQGLYGHGGHSH